MRVIFTFVALLASTPAFAQEKGAPEWWEIATGILAIPAGILGLAVAYASIRKTRLESAKIELEIREKEQLLAESGIASSPEAKQVAESIFKPFVDNNRVNYLILRFAIIYLLLAFWGIISQGFGMITGGAFLTAKELFDLEISGVPLIFLGIASQIMDFGSVLIIILFGIPLYRDIAEHIGFSVFRRRHLQQQ